MNLELENPREALWQELLYEAQQEANEGDGRAMRVLSRLRSKIEPNRVPVSRHQDDGN